MATKGGTAMYGNYPQYQQPQQFQNPYLERLMGIQQQAQPQRLEIIRVSGKNGAEAYQMPPNSSVLLLDDNNPIVWLKVTDGACYGTITAYDIKLHEDKKDDSVNEALNKRLSKIEQDIESIKSSHPQKNSSKPKE